MTADRLRLLLANLPDTDSEIYFHPATRRDPLLDRLMPAYEHKAELLALLTDYSESPNGRAGPTPTVSLGARH